MPARLQRITPTSGENGSEELKTVSMTNAAAVACAVVLFGLVQPSHAKAPVYTLTEMAMPDAPAGRLSNFLVLGINDKGQVLGEYHDGRALEDPQTYYYTHAVYWDLDGSLHELGRYIPYEICKATGINNSGKITGTCAMRVPNLPPGQDYFVQAFLWDARHGYRGLSVPFRSDLPGGLYPLAINTKGVIAGITWAENPDALYDREQQTVITVPTFGTRDPVPADRANRPSDLNDSEHYTFTEGIDASFQGRRGGLGDAASGTTVDIPPIAGTAGDIKVVPMAVNNSNVAVGYNFRFNERQTMRSFIWDATGGAKDLGTFYPNLNVTRCAQDINDAGQVIGQDDYRAYYYDETVGIKKLDQLIDKSDPRAVDFRVAFSYCDVNYPKIGYINNRGEIAVKASSGGRTSIYRLTPQ